MLWKSCFILSVGILLSTEAATLRCYKSSLNDYEVATLDNPETLVNSSCIKKDKGTVVYIFGFSSSANRTSTATIVTAYINKGKHNVLLLDWEEEAHVNFFIGFDLMYLLQGIPNAIRIGKHLGQALVTLSKFGVDLDTTECVGHSLGAHICGYTGKEVNRHGKALGTIIGLDPARPLYDHHFPLETPLDRTCAKFVYSLHTDPGDYGVYTSNATVDVWPNYGNFVDGQTIGSHIQPGCSFLPTGTTEGCSHGRAWQLHNESLYTPNSLLASKADDYYSWVAADGNSSTVISLGAIDRTATGNFYLTTNGSIPFGKGETGLKPDVAKRIHILDLFINTVLVKTFALTPPKVNKASTPLK